MIAPIAGWVIWAIFAILGLPLLLQIPTRIVFVDGPLRGQVDTPDQARRIKVIDRAMALLWIAGLVVTVVLPISKFHLLWFGFLLWFVVANLIFMIRMTDVRKKKWPS